MLGLFAEKDGFQGPEVGHALRDQLRALGKQVEVHVYPGVDHAFFNDERPEVYDATAAADAWERTVGFFRAHLR